jgi:spermidine/putrescine transport system substrate-binding protein
MKKSRRSRPCTAAHAWPPARRGLRGGGTINVYNWGQYIADGTDGSIDVNAAFTEATGIRVNYMTYDSNESLYTKLKTGGSTYDVIIPSDYMIARLIRENMLEPLDFSNIPNYRYVDEAIRTPTTTPTTAIRSPTPGALWASYTTASMWTRRMGKLGSALE